MELWPEIVALIENPKPEAPEGDTEISKARALLASLLKDGLPHDAAEIFAAAEGNIGERTIQRAAEAMGVVKTKAGFSGGWAWSLPEVATA